MRSHALFVFLAAVAAAGCGNPKATPTPTSLASASSSAPKDDLATAEGEWKVSKFEVTEDEKIPPGIVARLFLKVSGAQGEFGVGPQEVEYMRIRVDQTATPKTIDLELTNEKGETEFEVPVFRPALPGQKAVQSTKLVKLPKLHGVYKLDGDSLVVALAMKPTPRPTEFVPKSRAGQGDTDEQRNLNGVVVLHLKRGKPDAPPRERRETAPARTAPTSK